MNQKAFNQDSENNHIQALSVILQTLKMISSIERDTEEDKINKDVFKAIEENIKYNIIGFDTLYYLDFSIEFYKEKGYEDLLPRNYQEDLKKAVQYFSKNKEFKSEKLENILQEYNKAKTLNEDEFDAISRRIRVVEKYGINLENYNTFKEILKKQRVGVQENLR